jgi:tRNA pseudouridine38-40 synthase
MDTIEPILIITLKGQSFLLNQIRKMIGLAVEITCGSAPKTAVSLSLNPSKRVNIHMVPGTGLLLHHVIIKRV